MERLSDQYAKRLLGRNKRDSRPTYEAHSKTLQRRLNIMKAIGKNNLFSSANLHNQSNPFDKEFPSGARTAFLPDDIDCPIDVQYVSTWPNEEDEDQYPGVVTDNKPIPDYRNNLVGEVSRNHYSGATPLTRKHCKKSLSPKELNISSIEYRKSDHFRREGLERKSIVGTREWQEPTLQQRMSLGEYFGGTSRAELAYQLYLNNAYEDEFQRGNAELQRQGPDLFFGSARVLEVLEPEVVERDSARPMPPRRRSAHQLALVQENFKDFQQNLDVSTTMSLVSEDMRDLEAEMDKLDIDPDHKSSADEREQAVLTETPKTRIYPTLSKVEEKIVGPSSADGTNEETIDNDNYQSMDSESRDSFATPLPLPSAPMLNLDFTPSNNQEDSSPSSSAATSFFKRGVNSLFFSNLRLMKRHHRHANKPNLESTRKNLSCNPLTPVSQLGTTISTLTLPNTPISPDTFMPNLADNRQQQARMQQQYDMEATIPFEVENFLKEALGDGQHNMTSVTFTHPSDMRHRTYSNTMNASDVVSEEPTSPARNRKNNKNADTKLKHSKSLNRTLTIYRTLTHRIRNKFRNSVKNGPMAQADQADAMPTDLNPSLKNSVKRLLDKMEIYQAQIYQASKALDLCNSMREFCSGAERVEWERFLILTNLRKQAARDEIRRVTSSPCGGNNNNAYSEQGELNLSEISLHLREDVITRERRGGDVVEWFIVVVSQGLTVWASEVVACPISGPRIYVPGKLTLPGLTPDFRLTVSVYSMALQPIIMNHKDRFHIAPSRDSDSHSTSCPSPRKFLREKRRTKFSPKQYEIRFSGIKEPSFKRCGSVELMLHDINLKSPWPLLAVPSNSVLHGTIDLKLSCRLNLSVTHCGFLTHGDEADRSWWNRRWCVLQEHTLDFWNYPREQESKPPFYTIDLIDCVSKRIELIDRTRCARRHTLLVEILKKRCHKDDIRSSCAITKNLLSCDTQQDLVEWQDNLNRVVSALREWNIFESRSSLPISDL